jgi:hypothetical protein
MVGKSVGKGLTVCSSSGHIREWSPPHSPVSSCFRTFPTLGSRGGGGVTGAATFLVGHERQVDRPDQGCQVDKERDQLHGNDGVADEVDDRPVARPRHPRCGEVGTDLVPPSGEGKVPRLEQGGGEEDAIEGRAEQHLPPECLVHRRQQARGWEQSEDPFVPIMGGRAEVQESHQCRRHQSRPGKLLSGSDRAVIDGRAAVPPATTSLDPLGQEVGEAEYDPGRDALGQDRPQFQVV